MTTVNMHKSPVSHLLALFARLYMAIYALVLVAMKHALAVYCAGMWGFVAAVILLFCYIDMIAFIAAWHCVPSFHHVVSIRPVFGGGGGWSRVRPRVAAQNFY